MGGDVGTGGVEVRGCVREVGVVDVSKEVWSGGGESGFE